MQLPFDGTARSRAALPRPCSVVFSTAAWPTATDRKVIDFIRARPDNYDPDFEAAFHRLVDRLDSSATI
jgi:hypothetical protein